MTRYDTVIVGAGHGGAQAAISLRQQGFTGTIALVGAEASLPYERPPLSKEYLTGEKPFERLLIRPAEFWAEKDVKLVPGTRIVSVDPADRQITAADGTAIGYQHLIWAAGGTPRRLACEGADLAGVHVLRTRADSDAILADAGHARHVVIIGGGYIGLEAAASLRKLGKSVTVLEALPRVLARVAGDAISTFFQDEHRRQGVDIRLNARVARLDRRDGRVSAVILDDGTTLPADLMIAGIGIVPETGPLTEAGAAGTNGVKVDAFCQTSLDGIYAIGDCAAFPCVWADGAIMRVESVQNAADQAVTAARHIMGDSRPFDALPWFWSNQYDLKLQTVGLSAGHDRTILRGDPSTRSFSVIYLKNGQVIALDCVNAAKDFAFGRKLVMEGVRAAEADLANTAIALNALLPVREPVQAAR